MCLSVCVITLRMSLKEFLKHSKESRGVLQQERAQEREQASKQAGMQASRQTDKQAGKQAVMLALILIYSSLNF